MSAAPGQTVAVVAAPGDARRMLATYLQGAGFDTLECDHLPAPGTCSALVAVDAPETSLSIPTEMRSWMRLATHERVVVVTSNPAAFREFALVHAERMRVLPALSFGWNVADALRASPR